MRESREAPRADADPVADEPSPECPQLSVHQDQRGAEKGSRQASLRCARHGHREPAPPASRAEDCSPPAARAGARGPLDNTRWEAPRPAVGSRASGGAGTVPMAPLGSPAAGVPCKRRGPRARRGRGNRGGPEKGAHLLSPLRPATPTHPGGAGGARAPHRDPRAPLGGQGGGIPDPLGELRLGAAPSAAAVHDKDTQCQRQPEGCVLATALGGVSHTQTPVQTPSASVTATGRPSPRPAGHPPSDPQGWVVQQDPDNVEQAGQQLQGEVEQPDPQACGWGQVGEAAVRAPGAAGTLLRAAVPGCPGQH